MIINDQLHASASLFPGRGPRRLLNKGLFGPKGSSEIFERKNNYFSLFEIKSHYLTASPSLNTFVYQLSYLEIILKLLTQCILIKFSIYKTNQTHSCSILDYNLSLLLRVSAYNSAILRIPHTHLKLFKAYRLRDAPPTV
jgi:hypothetical protein